MPSQFRHGKGEKCFTHVFAKHVSNDRKHVLQFFAIAFNVRNVTDFHKLSVEIKLLITYFVYCVRAEHFCVLKKLHPEVKRLLGHDTRLDSKRYKHSMLQDFWLITSTQCLSILFALSSKHAIPFGNGFYWALKNDLQAVDKKIGRDYVLIDERAEKLCHEKERFIRVNKVMNHGELRNFVKKTFIRKERFSGDIEELYIDLDALKNMRISYKNSYLPSKSEIDTIEYMRRIDDGMKVLTECCVEKLADKR
jgi:hypothetical protein